MLSNASKLRHLAANAGRASSVNLNYFSAFSASSSSGLTSSITSPPPSTSCYSVRTLSQSAVLRKTFEPDYLDSSVPEIPAYPPINIQVKKIIKFILGSWKGNEVAGFTEAFPLFLASADFLTCRAIINT